MYICSDNNFSYEEIISLILRSISVCIKVAAPLYAESYTQSGVRGRKMKQEEKFPILLPLKNECRYCHLTAISSTKRNAP